MVSKLTFPTTQNQVLSKVNEIIDGKQDNLVSGTNIKTVNGNSLLGAGDITISGSGYHPDLFTWQWADHELNDVQWLRADTFSWQSGAVYQAAYQHLADDITGKTLQSETISGTTIQFYLADDGHKICPAGQESNVQALYNATGVAWYYILDTVNQRFKLPRTKFGFTGIRSGVGGYVEAGLPNITGGIGLSTTQMSSSGAFTHWQSGGAQGWDGWNNYGNRGFNFDASRSSSVYGNSTTVQPPATQMYLYFYVGNFTQTALENTAGLNTELFNDKADLDFGNTTMIDYVVEKQDPTSSNNYTWYRKYKSGWVEQGGIYNTSALTYLIPMADTNYIMFLQPMNTSGNYAMRCRNLTTTGASIQTAASSWHNYSWQVSGMAAN